MNFSQRLCKLLILCYTRFCSNYSVHAKPHMCSAARHMIILLLDWSMQNLVTEAQASLQFYLLTV